EELGERMMSDLAADAPAHEQPDVVPAASAHLGRSPGLEVARQLEFEDGSRDRGHARLSAGASTGSSAEPSAVVAASRSAARYRPLGGADSMRCRNPGTTLSGSGRSEMSSPGKASWCI